MSDFFDSYGRNLEEELARVHDAGPEGLRQREMSPDFFQTLIDKDLIEAYGPEHFKVSRRGLILLERRHMLSS